MFRLKWIFNKESGFTLVEILIAMALFSILSLSVWSILNYAASSSERTNAKIEVVENARVALDFMIDEIRRAEKIKIDYPSSNIFLGLEIDGNEGINVSAGKGDVEFKLENNKIIYNDIELVDNIQSVSFDPPFLDKDEDGVLDKKIEVDIDNDGTIDIRELDSNEDGLIDENLKITIETMPKGDIPSYTITGEVSIRYKKIAKE